MAPTAAAPKVAALTALAAKSTYHKKCDMGTGLVVPTLAVGHDSFVPMLTEMMASKEAPKAEAPMKVAEMSTHNKQGAVDVSPVVPPLALVTAPSASEARVLPSAESEQSRLHTFATIVLGTTYCVHDLVCNCLANSATDQSLPESVTGLKDRNVRMFIGIQLVNGDDLFDFVKDNLRTSIVKTF